MQYYRNAEVSKLYHVSLSAVSHWIDAARDNRNALKLIEDNKKFYIASSEKNRLVMTELTEQGKKFINGRSRKVVRPKPAFYKLFTESEGLDILASIETHREIPLRYTYFDGGAERWDGYASKLLGDEAPNTLTMSIDQLDVNKDYIIRAVGDSRVNIVDLGVGNALPVKSFLGHVLELGILNRYIAIDASQGMLQIAEKHIKEWFEDRVSFEGHVRDFTSDRFSDLTVADSFDDSNVCNIVFLLGGTLSNFRVPEDALRTINKSLRPRDLLIYDRKLDTLKARRHFDVDTVRYQLVPRLLNIDPSLYDIERDYDDVNKMRHIRLRLNVTLSIQVIYGGHVRTVTLDRGDSILLWRSWHWTGREVINQFYDNGFDILHTSQTNDHHFMQVIADVHPGEAASAR